VDCTETYVQLVPVGFLALGDGRRAFLLAADLAGCRGDRSFADEAGSGFGRKTTLVGGGRQFDHGPRPEEGVQAGAAGANLGRSCQWMSVEYRLDVGPEDVRIMVRPEEAASSS
jgi:hypothetical protein